MNQKILTQIKFVLQSNRTSLTLIKNPEKNVNESYGCGKCGVMNTNTKCLCCSRDGALEYFKLFGVRYGDTQPLKEFKSACDLVHFQ